ncbi:hypothetical protein OQE61_06610 [Cetobacterium somerae]|uniref:hypothetical protein n=1 Tax=Cetobacterium somerae TaxID=188913 RepID=UPI00225A4657|nr:hypothetical protein [Cetobacterium somerae]MCX3067161.1 hypothetical protein [Cetobacterium somerae]
MKKIVLLIGIISTTIFAATPEKVVTQPMSGDMMSKEMVHHHVGKMTPEMMQEEEQYQKEIDSKKLAIQKEAGRDKPDWNKIHKLHQEVGQKYADHATKMMKMQMMQN